MLADWRDAVAGAAPDEQSTAEFIWSLPVADELPEALRGLCTSALAGMWAGDQPRASGPPGPCASWLPAAGHERARWPLDFQGRWTPTSRRGPPGLEGALPGRFRRRRDRPPTVDWSNAGRRGDTLVIVRTAAGRFARRRRGDHDRRPQLGVDAEHRLLLAGPRDDDDERRLTRAFWDAAARSRRQDLLNLPAIREGDAAVRASYGTNTRASRASRPPTTPTTCWPGHCIRPTAEEHSQDTMPRPPLPRRPPLPAPMASSSPSHFPPGPTLPSSQ